MKISEVTPAIVSGFLHPNDENDPIIAIVFSAAKAYIIGQTGITLDNLDNYEDITDALLVLCSDMYDNRQMTVDKSNVNKVVQSILDMHCLNLL